MKRLMLNILCLRQVASVGAIAVRSVFANTTSATQEATAAQLNGPATISSKASKGPTTGNVADYIMQGLSTTTIHSTQTIFETVTKSNDSWQACQSSWVSWSEEYSKTLSPTVSTITNWTTLYNSYNITSGVGHVYTTIDDIPHVRGNFTPTAVGTYIWTYSEPDVTTSTITLDVNFTTPSPTCTIPVSQCSKLWSSYLLSLGITTPLNEATEPAITPMPTNRPRCSIGNASWSHTYQTWDNTCFISGDRVGLFYWPSATDDGTATPTPRANITSAPVTTVIRNFTFTSPSVYLSFNTLFAIQGHDIDEINPSQTVPLGATPQSLTLEGGYYPEPVGPTLTNKIISLDPTKLSSVIANLGPGVNTASAISEIAHGGRDYAKWVSALKDSSPVQVANNSYLIRPVDFASLTMPGTDDYYLQPSIAPGCVNPHGPHPACSTMFEGAYRAQLLVPQEVRNLAPEWAGCGIPLDGVYDPPSALHAAPSEAKPQAPSPAPAVSSDPITTSDPKTAPASSPEQPKPQPTVSDPLPEVTATPSSQPDSIQHTSNGENASQTPDPHSTQGAPAVGQSSAAAPSPSPVSKSGSSADANTVIGISSPQSEDPAAQTSVGVKASVTVDPVQTAASDRPQDPNPSPVQSASYDHGSGSSQNDIIVVGSQTMSVPAPSASSHMDAPVADPTGPTNALSILAAAQSSQAQPAVSQPKQSAPQTPSMAAVLSLADSTIIVASPQHGSEAITIGSATLSSGGPAATVNGQRVSVGSQGVVVDSQTISYATYRVLNGPASAQSDADPVNAPPDEAVTTPTVAALVFAGSSSMVIASPTGSDHAVAVGSTTIVPGGPAVTVHGHKVSAASKGVIVDSQMVDYSTMIVPASSMAVAAVTVDDHTYSFYQASGSNAVVIDGHTLSVGSNPMTISGQALTIGSNAVIIGSQTVSFSNADTGLPSPSIVELGAGTYVYGSQTITAGGAAHADFGHTVTAVSSGLVVDGTTLLADTTETSGMTASNNPKSTGSHASAATSISSTASLASATTSRSTASTILAKHVSCIVALLAVMISVLAL